MTETKQQSEADRTGKMEAVVEPPPASESSLELDADDILEVDGVPSNLPPKVVVADDVAEERSEAPADRTLPMKRSDVVAAAAKAADLQELDYELPQVTKIILPTPAPPKTSPVLTTTKAMPGQNVVAPSHHPPSVAPVAMDRTPTTALPLPPPPMKSPAVPIVVGGVLLAAILGIAGAAAGFALGSEPEKSTATAPSASAAASSTTTAEAPATVAAASPPPAPSPDPVTVPQTPAPKSGGFSEGTAAQPAPTLDNMPSSDVTSLPSAPNKSAPPPQHAFVAAADPPPAPAPRPAAPPPPKPSAPPAKTAQAALPPPAAPATQSTTGVVRVPISNSIVTIQVDGHFRRVNNGAVIVSCGPHSVRVGSSMAKDVNVPCGGSVSVD